MRVVWVPQWAVLPVVVEDHAVIEEPAHGHQQALTGQTPSASHQTQANVTEVQSSPGHRDHQGSQIGHPPPNTQSQHQQGMAFNHGHSHMDGRRQSPGAFDLNSVAGALPDYQGLLGQQPPSFDSPHHLLQQSSALPGYQTSQYGVQTASGPYSVDSSYYGNHGPGGVVQSGFAAGQRVSHGQPQVPTTFAAPYYNGQTQRPHQIPQYIPFANQFGSPMQVPYQAQMASGSSPSFNSHSTDYHHFRGQSPRAGFSQSSNFPSSPPATPMRTGNTRVNPRNGPSTTIGSIPSTPRGPPRKPKQSGNALWVGNLPSGANVTELKDHFSKDATKEIESVFLISKSNCAFVNYKSESACAEAMARFHDSRFNGVRLVCRLRRTPMANSVPGVPTGPAALTSANAQNQTALDAIAQNREESSKALEQATSEITASGEPAVKVPNKYFVMKSLTVEDMELSVRNSIWATQSHNEEALNRAYETAANVFLIFSANKSGEYFGVARMTSPISEEAAANLDWAPRGQVVITDPDVPRSIPTPATETAPKGRIIDDSARGTIFWEADPGDGADQSESETNTEHEGEEEEGLPTSGDAQAFGKPFKIEWVTTNRLPFYRTRGLRNPWNANREVKIARDGTELETSVGRRLVQMFQRLDQPSAAYGVASQ